ncbi:hypothetical protein TVAGG3_0876740 [Trichomonas vaginalis G3]|uniref:hypothetical protein n=1 Tax=Trichomonas vaginalis (strain ATCC PRA-98 / G3) TaxID=412133 RepID=UPI0021E5E367|nr:hypothetical protein TVAGG3_0876740 [Trichomonas vaginalis G3]KAI5501745.1 hypothetical protein TVAGG3_0876740 [Trichomonas vaginalis G3]
MVRSQSHSSTSKKPYVPRRGCLVQGRGHETLRAVHPQCLGGQIVLGLANLPTPLGRPPTQLGERKSPIQRSELILQIDLNFTYLSK